MSEPVQTADKEDLFSDESSYNRTVIINTKTVITVRKCRLSVAQGPGAPREMVSEKELIRVGRHSNNDLTIEDPTVSRHHFEIRHTPGGYVLTDLGSDNGTLVDGIRIKEGILRPGALIRFGESAVSFAPMEEKVTVEPEGEEFFNGAMVGKSMRMRQIFGLIKKVAPLDVSVVIQGETGTGKELVARALHELSGRKKGPFEVIDCGSIPANLIESELFGHEKGAFTGAVQSRPGAFERGNSGTVFLDELGELPLDLQPKLLRVLENREVRRVGSSEIKEVDIRIIAATNRDLQKEVQAGNFREDLYFRLSVIALQLPALRQRREDIEAIIRHALNAPAVVGKHGRKEITPGAMGVLASYPWPGNVRELMNVVSHLLTFSDGPMIDVDALPPRLSGVEPDRPLPFNEHLSFKEAKERLLETFEKEYITTILKRCDGNISRAARESGLHRKSIERLLKKYSLEARSLRGAATPRPS